METVLIIEDDAALSRGLKDNFSFQGYNVLLAADGEKGLSLAIDAAAGPDRARPDAPTDERLRNLPPPAPRTSGRARA